MSRSNLSGEQIKAYDGVIDKLAEEYKPKALALLTRIGEVCRTAGMTTDEPCDASADEYRYELGVWRTPEQNDSDGVIVSIVLAEALEYGDDEAELGVNFGLDIVSWGGRILGGLAPFNYTEQVWVDARDADAVSERWQILETADLGEIPNLILEER